MRRARLSLAVAAGAALALACGAARLPAPRWTGQPTSALSEVPYPPPPARIESVPAAPDPAAVWIDGEWTWRARRWAWKPGRWVRPPAGAKFAPWVTVRDPLGTLYFAEGAWRDADGDQVAEPPPLATAGEPTTVVVSSEGDEIRRGPTLALDAGAVRARPDAPPLERLEALPPLPPASLGGATVDARSDP